MKPASVSEPARAALLALARATIAAQFAAQPPVTIDDPLLAESRGVFVTLTRDGRLRGCIGRVDPDEPLSTLLPEMAIAAAFHDPRFPPVTAGELPHLRLEVSLLTPPRAAKPDDVIVGVHGVMVSGRGRRGLFLPGVATEWGWTRDELLDEVCRKASLPADAWRSGGATLHTFETVVLAETEPA